MTAVEWLATYLKGITSLNCEEVIEQALQMEKQDIISAYAFGHNDGCRYMTNEKQEFEHGEAYYQETFKQDL
jgi:hypothetical protein